MHSAPPAFHDPCTTARIERVVEVSHRDGWHTVVRLANGHEYGATGRTKPYLVANVTAVVCPVAGSAATTVYLRTIASPHSYRLHRLR